MKTSPLNAIELILSQQNRAMTAAELTHQLLQQNLWQSNGKTPDATIGARLYTDIKKHGSKSRFVKAGKGIFALNHARTSLPPVKTAKRAPRKKTTVQPSQTYSFLDCAEKVLQNFAERKPMHYRDITLKALELGWLNTNGQTPDASMGAQIYMDIKRCKSQGRMSRFITAKGMVSLTEWTATGLERQIEKYNETQRDKLLKRVKDLSPQDFEKLVSTLLTRMGFEQVSTTSYCNDHGVDVRGILTVHESIKIKLAVQAKRWQNNVDATIVQNLRGSVDTDERGLIVTTSDFSTGAKKEATLPNKHVPIDLINGKQLVSLLVEHELGVKRNQYQMLQLQESFFDDEEA